MLDNKIPEIEQIFSSKTLTDEEKVSQLEDLSIEYMDMNKYELILIFNYDTFSIIKKRLNHLSTKAEFELLNILESVVDSQNDELEIYGDNDSIKTLIYDELN